MTAALEPNNFQVFEEDLDHETLSHYLEAEAIAVDTETMGLIPQRDRLCLVQLCDDKRNVSVIRVVKGQTQAPKLHRLMEAPTITKVFHFARFDVAQLQHTFHTRVHPIFCTKIASKLARTYSSSHGLKTLVGEIAGVELDKSAQSSDWGNAANLSETQFRYAANDVLYLLHLREQLTQMLKREERWELAQHCFTCLPTFVNLDLANYSNIFEH